MARNLTIILDGLNGDYRQGVLTSNIVTSLEYKDQIGAVVNFCSLDLFKIDRRGATATYKFVPVGALNPNTELFIGPESEISLRNYEEDYRNHQKTIGERPIYIPENAKVKLNHKDGFVPAKECASELEKIGNTKVLNMREWFARFNAHLGKESERIIVETPAGKPVKYKEYLYSPKSNMSVSQINTILNSHNAYNGSLVAINTCPISAGYNRGIDEYTDLSSVGTPYNLTVSELNLAVKNNILPVSYYIKDGEENFLRLNRIKSNLNVPGVKEKLIALYNSLSDKGKQQIFGRNFKQSISSEDLDLIKALEIERVSKHIYGNSVFDKYRSFVISTEQNMPVEITDYSKFNGNNGINLDQLKRITTANQPNGIVLIDPVIPFHRIEDPNKMNVKNVAVESIEFFSTFLEKTTHTPVVALVSSSEPNNIKLLNGPLLQPVLERRQ